ncbi:hypothetical protein QJS10_CPB19g00453 [Acorus calamus]|uniref:Uncharacterized protein n=1 Tax=Acorus calamus TaxID=4465 RepID=A0AAV9CF12_ACOCL|nr:hypothetical protein QJS10_CPB19g00453 [Acorus calamus]
MDHPLFGLGVGGHNGDPSPPRKNRTAGRKRGWKVAFRPDDSGECCYITPTGIVYRSLPKVFEGLMNDNVRRGRLRRRRTRWV